MARPTSLMAALAAMVPKVMICATLVAAIFLGDVLDHFAAAAHAEIDIDIRHGDALRIQEALEEQIVLQRIHVRDLQRVTRPGCPPPNRVPAPPEFPARAHSG